MSEPRPLTATSLVTSFQMVSSAFEPGTLVRRGARLSVPGVAGMSFLSSRRSVWEAHALVVGFAGEVLGYVPPGSAEPGTRNVVAEFLSEGGFGIADWFTGSARGDFLSFWPNVAGRQSDERALVAAGRVIDRALVREELGAARALTTIEARCAARCADDRDPPGCFLRCMGLAP
jgi:hypothetical protein